MGKIDYSGFSQVHSPRTHAAHKAAGSRWIKTRTLSERHAIESETGSRFSQLNLLPYFDSINFSVIDPMHCLFLGTAKHVLKKVYLNESFSLIQQKDFKRIHDIVDKFIVPSSNG